MLELIIQILGYIKQFTYFGLLISYKTGQWIVYGLKLLIELLVVINKCFGTVLSVLQEDFYIFSYDVGQRLLLITTFLTKIVQDCINCVVSVYDTIRFVVLGIVYTITKTYTAIFSAISKVLAGIGTLFITIKYFVVLVGSGIWFALTFIPLFIVYTCTMLVYYLGCFLDEFVNFSKKSVAQSKLFINSIYEFITDVPLEAAAGLIAGACILYVIVKFQILLYQKLLSAIELIRQNSQQIRSRLTRRFTRNPQPVRHSSPESEQTDSSDESSNAEHTEDRFCIICQERNKCILMLPCRHVCLCGVCNIRLRNYNRTCPICRTVVQKTMKVFV